VDGKSRNDPTKIVSSTMEVKPSDKQVKESSGPTGTATARKSFGKSISGALSFKSKASDQKSKEGENLFKQPVRVQPRKSFGGAASKRPSTR